MGRALVTNVEKPPAAGARPSGRRKRGLSPARVLFPLGQVAFLVALLSAWQWGLPLLNVPRYLVPLPSQIGKALYEGYAHGNFWKHTVATFKEVIVGYGIGVAMGLGLGVMVAESRLLDRLFSPYIIAMNALPKIAIAPLMVVWFGQGLTAKVLVTALVAFFPLLVNVTVGLKSIDQEQLDLMRGMTASRWQIFTKMKFRHGLPHIFAGLEIAMVLAVVGAVVAEFVGAQEGLGYYIQLSLALVNPAGMFAMLIVLAVMSYVLYEIVHRVGQKLVFWQGIDRFGNGGT
jgi:NitT/TauT family transport system permease protein